LDTFGKNIFFCYCFEGVNTDVPNGHAQHHEKNFLFFSLHFVEEFTDALHNLPMVKPSKTHEETINQNNLNYKKMDFYWPANGI
jgi:hypothetical protein